MAITGFMHKKTTPVRRSHTDGGEQAWNPQDQVKNGTGLTSEDGHQQKGGRNLKGICQAQLVTSKGSERKSLGSWVLLSGVGRTEDDGAERGG